MSSALLSQLAFAASFLRVREEGGAWFRAFLGAGLVTLAVWALSGLVPFEARVRLYAFNYLVLALVILGSGVAKVRAEGYYYVIYLLGWFPLVLSILQVAVVIHGSAAPGPVLTASYKMVAVLYIQILHMFLHAVALILRVRALREEKLRAEFLSRSKSRFIAQSSHDLSQPLHAMSLFLEHLRPHVRDAEGRRLFQRLRATHRRMSGAFQSIMDLGRLEAGAVTPAPGRAAGWFTAAAGARIPAAGGGQGPAPAGARPGAHRAQRSGAAGAHAAQFDRQRHQVHRRRRRAGQRAAKGRAGAHSGVGHRARHR
ncbi:hypothetical protein HML84_00630 [Alcanivorax sp. IO_7]|nr:hypothetical protein HML84_00630 [Alcanivorax sp. IO_7]